MPALWIPFRSPVFVKRAVGGANLKKEFIMQIANPIYDVVRLQSAILEPEMRKQMEIEDGILGEFESS